MEGGLKKWDLTVEVYKIEWWIGESNEVDILGGSEESETCDDDTFKIFV